MSDLDARLLAAHKNDNRRALVELYTEAADGSDDLDRSAFYLVQAYVFALEVNHPAHKDLHQRLKSMNRES